MKTPSGSTVRFTPLLQEMAVLAAAESGDRADARRLRARWGRTLVRDWASEQGELVGSPHQVALADSHLARVAATA